MDREAMKREEKAKLVGEYREKLMRASATFLADYRGTKANDINEVRRALREAGVELRVLKNTLARLAVKDTPAEALSGEFTGPVALVLSYNDPAIAAKRLTQFSDDLPCFTLRMATLGNRVLKKEEIRGLAQLPPREVSVGKLLGIMKNVPASLVWVLSGVPRKLIYALNAVKTAKEKAQ